ncbi:MAG: lipocalin-like domain-containing protein [Pseudomonadota bacterium]
MGLTQGFAGLGAQADGFAIPERGTAFDFPADHGAHPDFRIEWWYITANLTGADGQAYGVQWTLFRSALAPETTSGWGDPQIWFAHAAVTSKDVHLVAERVARGGIGQAGVRAAPFEAWIDDWALAGPDFDSLRMTARGPDFAYDLALMAEGPLVFHGDGGYSVKSAKGQASYYYSQPFYKVSGVLDLPDGPVEVTGQAWLDREWSSQPLAEEQSGWDWFSVSFEDGHKLMGFQLRQSDGANFTSGTWIAPDGRVEALLPGQFAAQALELTAVQGRDIPTAWRVKVAHKGVDVQVSALNPNAWMGVSLPYWEGPVTVRGSHAGRGYLEMTGYE